MTDRETRFTTDMEKYFFEQWKTVEKKYHHEVLRRVSLEEDIATLKTMIKKRKFETLRKTTPCPPPAYL